MRVFGGTVQVAKVANAGTNQPLGISNDTNLQGGSTLRYVGTDVAGHTTNKRLQVGRRRYFGRLGAAPDHQRNPSNRTTIGGKVYDASIYRATDGDLANLTLTGAGNAVVNGSTCSPRPGMPPGRGAVGCTGRTGVAKTGAGAWTLNQPTTGRAVPSLPGDPRPRPRHRYALQQCPCHREQRRHPYDQRRKQ